MLSVQRRDGTNVQIQGVVAEAADAGKRMRVNRSPDQLVTLFETEQRELFPTLASTRTRKRAAVKRA